VPRAKKSYSSVEHPADPVAARRRRLLLLLLLLLLPLVELAR